MNCCTYGHSAACNAPTQSACVQTADKAVVEGFPEPNGADLVLEVVRWAVSPGQVGPLPAENDALAVPD